MSYRIRAVFKVAQAPVSMEFGGRKAAALAQAKTWARNTSGLRHVDVVMDYRYRKRAHDRVVDRSAVLFRVRPTKSGAPRVTEYTDPLAPS